MPLRYCQKIMMMMHHRCFQEVVVSSPLLDPAKKKSHHRRRDLETSCLLLLLMVVVNKSFVVVHVVLFTSFAAFSMRELCFAFCVEFLSPTFSRGSNFGEEKALFSSSHT